MSIIKANGAGEVSTGFYGFEIDNSLRFDDESNAYLNISTLDGNEKTFTYSTWVKRGDITSATQVMFHAWNGSSNRRGQLLFNSSNEIMWEIGGSSTFRLITNAVFRDISAWYNIVVVADVTNSTQADRLRLYVNGTRITSFSTEDQVTNDSYSAGSFNNDNAHHIGMINTTSNKFDGYMAEINFIDGQALDASSFGETKSGVWIPKDTSGLTFGTTGFRLEFKQTGTGTASSSTIGADTGGNDKHFTSNNLGAFDVMPDSPTNNFAVMNPLVGRGLGLYVDPRHGNLEMDTRDSGRGTTFSTLAMSPGTGEKYYAEYRYRADSGHMRVGVITVDDAADYLETSTFDDGTVSSSYTSVTGKIFVDGTEVYDDVTYTTGNVIGIALDLENGSIEYFKDGTSIHSESNSIFSSNSFLFAAGDSSNSADIRYSANFGQDSTFANDETAATNADTNGIGAFHTAVPSGFKALCTANLPEPPITPLNDDLPEDYFNAVLYDGNSADRNIEVGFKSDFIWVKHRTSAGNHHRLYNVIAGEHACLFSSNSNAESTASDGIAFDFATGFNIDDGANRFSYNQSSNTYVSWNWLAGGSASSNEDGNLASSVSANQKAGFSIVSYTGTGSATTIGHGLSSAPDLIIVKNRDDGSKNWVVQVTALGNNYLELNKTNDAFSSSIYFNNTAPTSSVFSVGTVGSTNASGDDFIAYCLHSVEGYSKMGAYTGNGNTEGQYIYTGFRPAYVLIKQSSANGNNWSVHDNKRDVDNVVNTRLLASTTGAETTFTTLDFLSNGFKLRTTGTAYNGNGSTYIYMAFAEMPTKYANAR